MSNRKRSYRRGHIVVVTAFLVPILAGFGAFAVDVGYIEYSRSCLQAGADAAAMAAVQELPSDQETLDSIALRYVTLNNRSGSTPNVILEGGSWDEDTAVFTPSGLAAANAVRVSVVAPDSSLFFGTLLGKSHVDIIASAIAAKPGGIGVRFLIDDEMIDKDVPSIESLADSLGRDAEELVTARGFNQGKQYGDSNWTWEDNFLDIPAGVTITLPTGQGTDYDNNDAGMFDIDHPEFPFTDAQNFEKFVMYSESGNDSSKWGSDYDIIYSQLDPLKGVAPVTDGSTYESFVNPDFVHVSPVFPSDISTLNMQGGVPRVNAKGLRRGLIAFKIIAVGNDVDGNGSVLPELVLEIVDPSTIDLNDLDVFGTQRGITMLVK